MRVDTVEYKGYDIDIFIDEFCESPREWDNLGTMICFHRRYSLGDKHDLNEDDFNSWSEIKDFLYKEYNALLVIPLYLYDHSGITMNTTGFYCPWDSGQVGYIYVSKEKVREEWNVKRISRGLKEKVRKILVDEVRTYDDYIRGDVYGYNITDPITEQSIDSCWGFYGADGLKHAIQDYAEPVIDCYIKKMEKEIINSRIKEV